MKKEKAQQERATYDIAEFGQKLGISKNAAYNAANRGEIPTIRIGGRILIPRAALDKLLENGK